MAYDGAYTKPNQEFRIVMPIDGENKPLRVNLRYNRMAEYWIMAITNDITGELMVDDVALLCGVYPSANLLEQNAYMGLGSLVIIKTDPDLPYENPTDTTLGNGFEMIWNGITL